MRFEKDLASQELVEAFEFFKELLIPLAVVLLLYGHNHVFAVVPAAQSQSLNLEEIETLDRFSGRVPNLLRVIALQICQALPRVQFADWLLEVMI